MTHQRPPLPPFTSETATQKVRLAEDAWNSRDPDKVSLAYTPDSRWRNRAEFLQGRDAIVQFLRHTPTLVFLRGEHRADHLLEPPFALAQV